LARDLAHRASAEAAIDLAAKPDNVEEAREDIRWALSHLYVEFPKPSLLSIHQAREHFDAWENGRDRGKALKAKTSAVCKYYESALEGGRVKEKRFRFYAKPSFSNIWPPG